MNCHLVIWDHSFWQEEGFGRLYLEREWKSSGLQQLMRYCNYQHAGQGVGHLFHVGLKTAVKVMIHGWKVDSWPYPSAWRTGGTPTWVLTGYDRKIRRSQECVQFSAPRGSLGSLQGYLVYRVVCALEQIVLRSMGEGYPLSLLWIWERGRIASLSHHPSTNV